MKTLYKTLVIDTATNYYYSALIDDDKVLEEEYSLGHNDHSKNLMPSIERILNRNNVKLNELENVLVGIGPGSYTGVRIGVVVAKMIGFLNNINVYTFSSLDLLASAKKEDGHVLSLIDARRGNAFMAYYELKDSKLVKIKEDVLASIEDYKNNLNEEYEVITLGNPNPILLKNSDLLESVSDISSLVPNYLQITEAERNKNGN